jgi:hypothetical protein
MANPEHARHRAEAFFKKKEVGLEGQKAMEEYRADPRATQEKTARLRKLRLARAVRVPIVATLEQQFAIKDCDWIKSSSKNPA